MRRTRSLVLLVFALALLTAACASSGGSSSAKAPEASPAGDIPDTQAFVAFTPPAGGYAIKVPEGWAQSIDGTKAVFTDHFNTVIVDSTVAANEPTAASVRTVEVPSLQRAVPGFHLRRIDTVDRTAGPAVVTTYRAQSSPDPVTGKRVSLDVERYKFWRSGKLVEITVSGARGSDNGDPWKTITNSFAWSA